MQILETLTDPAWGTLRDVDLTRGGAWVGVFAQPGGGHRVVFGDGDGFGLDPELSLQFPLVRWLDAGRVLVLDLRNRGGGCNARVLDRQGATLASFCAGDAIADVVVLQEQLVVTYFDEGVFGDVEPSQQGLAYFDFEGRLLGAYLSHMGAAAVDVADCYCAVRVDHRTLAFSPYTDFPLVLLKPASHTQKVLALPQALRGAGALSMHGSLAYFYSPYAQQGTFLCWSPWHRHPQEPVAVGQGEGRMRGLEEGRFVGVDEAGFRVIVMEGAEGFHRA